MFSRAIKPCKEACGGMNFSTTNLRQFKVAILGASGGIGQPLSLLLKLNSLVTHLSLYDIAKMMPGVAMDISHIDTSPKVTGHCGPENICQALRDSDVVVIPAGKPRKPGMTRDDLFSTNARIVRDLSTAVAKYIPTAILVIITNPVNSMVPIASEVYKKVGVYDPKRIFGCTTLDIVRSSTFIGQINGVDPQTVKIPVVCGHSGVSIIPVMSQATPCPNLNGEEEIKALISKIQDAGTQVVKAKAGAGSATLAMAYSGARFTCSVLRALAGEGNVIECAFVKSELGEAPYFAGPVLLNKAGLGKELGYGTLNDFEQKLLQSALPVLKKNIKTGEDFVNKESVKCT